MVQYRRWVARLTILSGLIGLTSYLLVAEAVNFNFDFFSDTSLIFSTVGVSSSLLKWSMITDIFGYYLLLLPLLFFIHEWLKDKTAWRSVFTFCGGAYIFAGAMGAAILGAAWPSLLDQYQLATPENQEVIKSTFATFSLLVMNGIWNFFDSLVFAVWFIAIGFFIKKEHGFWGWFTIVVGLLSVFDFLGNALDMKAVADTALNLYLVLAPLWAIAFGWALNRNKVLTLR